MGKLFVIGLSKNRKAFEIPLEKYGLTGEIGEFTPDNVRNIATSLGINLNEIDFNQLFIGTKEEWAEHADVIKGNLEDAVRIAYAHVKEIPDYYDRLKIMEGQAKKPEPEVTESGSTVNKE